MVPWWRSRAGWRAFVARLYREYENDGVADHAAALGFYFVFALFPFLFFLATLSSYIPFIRTSMDTLLERARYLLPPEAFGLVETHVRGLVDQPRPQLLTISLAVALYSASRGLDAVRKALNLAWDIRESRPIWKTEVLAFGLTIGGGLLVLAGVAVVMAGGGAGLWAAGHLGIADGYVLVLGWIRWPFSAVVVLLSVALVYHLLPDVKRPFRLVSPGSAIATLLWFVASWGFSAYVSNFGSYNITYGSIGGVIVLMTWFYITGFILILGGEIDVGVLRTASFRGTESPDPRPPPPDGVERRPE